MPLAGHVHHFSRDHMLKFSQTRPARPLIVIGFYSYTADSCLEKPTPDRPSEVANLHTVLRNRQDEAPHEALTEAREGRSHHLTVSLELKTDKPQKPTNYTVQLGRFAVKNTAGISHGDVSYEV